MLNFKERTITTFIFIFTITLLFMDIFEDVQEGATFEHVGKEALVMAMGLFGVIILWYKYFKLKKSFVASNNNLEKLKIDLEGFKQKSLTLSEGLSDLINLQLNNWGLTESEKDVALLLLKGLSIKEIAIIRNSSEKTIKQHSSNLYSKANLSGRAELSAFFLEDMLTLK